MFESTERIDPPIKSIPRPELSNPFRKRTLEVRARNEIYARSALRRLRKEYVKVLNCSGIANQTGQSHA